MSAHYTGPLYLIHQLCPSTQLLSFKHFNISGEFPYLIFQDIEHSRVVEAFAIENISPYLYHLLTRAPRERLGDAMF